MFNLWPHDQLSSPLLYFYLALLCIFFCKKQQKQQPPPLFNLNTTQPLTTNPVTTTYVFLFKFYWGFSILNKQYSFFLYIFIVYVFCLGTYSFYNFFLTQIYCMNLWFVYIRVCFRFYKIIFVCKLMRLKLNF